MQHIPRKTSDSLTCNYCYISILFVLFKVKEKVINQQKVSYPTHLVNKSFELCVKSQIIALSMSKQFAKVWHRALPNKLQYYGSYRLPQKVCSNIRSFLSHRFITVALNGHNFNFHSVNAGVPRGSVRALTLFLLYINDSIRS